MMTRHVLSSLAAVAAIVAGPAAARAEGSVKVECWGRCDLVTLGQICSTFAPDALPTAVACVHPNATAGTNKWCGGSVTCLESRLFTYQALSEYCDDGPGFDAVVSCRENTGAAVIAPPALSREQGPAGSAD